MEEFAVALGLYTTDEVRQPIYTESIHTLPDDQMRHWWRAVSDTPMPPDDSSGLASSIRDPLHRYILYYIILYYIILYYIILYYIILYYIILFCFILSCCTGTYIG